MAIGMGTTVEGRRGGTSVRLSSDAFPGEGVVFELPVTGPVEVPEWGRYALEVARGLGAVEGFEGRVASDLPIGAGLSSSASLEVAVALALGFRGTPRGLAELCQAAEQRASGVPCGVMDQLAAAAGVAGHALLIDCSDLSVRAVPVPASAQIVVVPSGEVRRLAGSPYSERRQAGQAAEVLVGPLRSASPEAVEGIEDPLLRARARHVVTENARVATCAAALTEGDLVRAGELMAESHRSLAVDFEVSTPVLDDLVADLSARPGVYGARLTGAGFGGCVVALTRPGALDRGWRVAPAGGAHVTGGGGG